MDLRSCLRKTLDQTGFVCVSDGRLFCNYAMLEKMEKMLLHRHHSFLRLGFHRRIHLLPISRSDKVTQGGYVFQYFHRQNPTIAVRARNKFLAEYEGKAEGKLQAKAFGLLRRNISTILLNAPLASLGVQSGKTKCPVSALKAKEAVSVSLISRRKSHPGFPATHSSDHGKTHSS